MSFVILDRDGVINFDSPDYIKSPDEWRAIPGSLEAIAYLNRAGFSVLVATNQSGIARGFYDLETLDLIHDKLMQELASVGGFIDEFFACPHHPDENCSCRKPKPGLLYQIQSKYPINLTSTFFIGDSYSDVQAAKASGCKPILVLTGNGSRSLKSYAELAHVPHFPDLMTAVHYVVSEER